MGAEASDQEVDVVLGREVDYKSINSDRLNNCITRVPDILLYHFLKQLESFINCERVLFPRVCGNSYKQFVTETLSTGDYV